MSPREKLKYIRDWQRRNKAKKSATQHRYYLRNRERILARGSAYTKQNKLAACDRVKRYQKKYPERVRERARKYRERNPEKVRISKRLAQRRLMAKSLQARLKHNLRTRLGAALKANTKSGQTLKMLGCSIEDFKIYIESLWSSGMNWGNYGLGENKWQIDHIMPCAVFDLEKPEHQRRCFHFSNMQPMWQVENYKKGAKIVTKQFQLL